MKIIRYLFVFLLVMTSTTCFSGQGSMSAPRMPAPDIPELYKPVQAPDTTEERRPSSFHIKDERPASDNPGVAD